MDDQLKVTTTTYLNQATGPFTVMMWFKPTNLTQTDTYLMISRTTGGNQTAIIWEFVNNQVEFFSTGFSGTNPRTSSGITISDTGWHHIAYRKSASGASEWAYYLDGAKTVINASIDFTLGTTTDFLALGSSDGGNYVNARLAEVYIWSATALTDKEIAMAAYGHRVRRPFSAGDGYWPLYGDASPETDYSGKLKNLTVTGTTAAGHPPVGPQWGFSRGWQGAFTATAAAGWAHLLSDRRDRLVYTP